MYHIPNVTNRDANICLMLPRLRSRASIRVTTAFHSARAEDEQVLKRLETVVKTDPEALRRLSALLSPSTTRDLTRALHTVQQSTTKAAAGTETAASKSRVRQLTTQELQMVALQVGLPFIGFGFVDNFIMILAGDYIDLTLGVSLGISSMAAAGIGNTISDIAGLGLGNVVEDLCARLGLPVPALTTEQMMLKRTRLAKVVGSSVGVTIGCLLGMVPLLFLHTRDKDDSRDPVKVTP
uniref:Transmembrane protein 65 n=1 Tax=Hyaloperonospora arabidopsidis (strain Emoy2) TaxID=559515 RepID=M4BAQ6_HYAAE